MSKKAEIALKVIAAIAYAGVITLEGIECAKLVCCCIAAICSYVVIFFKKKSKR